MGTTADIKRSVPVIGGIKNNHKLSVALTAALTAIANAATEIIKTPWIYSPRNRLGLTFRFTIVGTVSNSEGTSKTFTVQLVIGGVTIADVVMTVANGATNVPFHIEGFMTLQSISRATGTFKGSAVVLQNAVAVDVDAIADATCNTSARMQLQIKGVSSHANCAATIVAAAIEVLHA